MLKNLKVALGVRNHSVETFAECNGCDSISECVDCLKSNCEECSYSIHVAIVVSVKIVYTTEVCRCWLQESCVQLL